MNSTKPFSPACERNKAPILEVLKSELASGAVLEVGSGTGQHAVYFTRHLPLLNWQTADLEERHAGIKSWLLEANSTNLHPPIVLDLLDSDWKKVITTSYDGLYTANTLHILPWPAVENLFAMASKVVRPSGVMIIYGPFKYKGEFTSSSNRDFDKSLRQQNPDQGIRDFEDITDLAAKNGLSFLRDYPMPANNQTLIFKKE